MVGAAAGELRGSTGSPLVSEIPVSIDTHALREFWVNGASFAPKSVTDARIFVTCGIKNVNK